MSFLYPRIISVNRQTTSGSIGDRGYQGSQPATETLIVDQIPASIQLESAGSAAKSDVPSRATGRGSYRILIPLASLALGVIERDDIIIDDIGGRYQVADPYWDSMGYNIRTESIGV